MTVIPVSIHRQAIQNMNLLQSMLFHTGHCNQEHYSPAGRIRFLCRSPECVSCVCNNICLHTQCSKEHPERETVPRFTMVYSHTATGRHMQECTHTHKPSGLTYIRKCTHTFQAADPPQARVGEGSGVFLVLVVGVVLSRVGSAVADEGPRVQPVVCADSHRHQGKSGKGPNRGEEHLDPPLTPHHRYEQEEIVTT